MEIGIELITGTLLTIIIGVISFFLKRTLSDISAALKEHELKFTKMDERITINKTNIELNTQRDKLIDGMISDKLDAIGKMLEKMEGKIEKMEDMFNARK